MINKGQEYNQGLLKFIFHLVTLLRNCLSYVLVNANVPTHLLWVDERRLPKIMLNYKLRSYAVGGPRISWLEEFFC
jgi:hypothetical protein